MLRTIRRNLSLTSPLRVARVHLPTLRYVLALPQKSFLSQHITFPFYHGDLAEEDFGDIQLSPSVVTTYDDGRLFNYIDICVQIGKIDHAWSFLKSWISRPRVELETDLFNIIMFAYATQADFEKLENILEEMERARVKSNIFTHIAVLGCLGKIGAPAEGKAGEYIGRVAAKGFDFNQVFDYIFIDNLDLTEAAKALLRSRGFCSTRGPRPDADNNLVRHLEDVKTAKNISFGCLSEEEAEASIQEQLDAERLSFQKLKLISCRDFQGQQPYRMMYDNLKKEWRRVLRERIDKFQSCERFANSISVVPYALFFSPDEAAAFMVEDIEEFIVFFLQGSRSVMRGSAAMQIGHKFHQRISFRRKHNIGELEQIVSTYRKFVRDVAQKEELPFNLRRHWCRLFRQDEGSQIMTFYRDWGSHTLSMVGNFFLDLIVENVRVNKNLLSHNSRTASPSIPAFYGMHTYFERKVYLELKLHPVVLNLFKEANIDTVQLDMTFLPMKTPPIPWLSLNSGPFMSFHYKLIRSPLPYLTNAFVSRYPLDSYKPVLDSISSLQTTPWAINSRVFRVMLHLFDHCYSLYLKGYGERLRFSTPHSSDSLEDLMVNYAFLKPSSDPQCIETTLRNIRLKLSIANHLMHSPFWFPLFIDFRGRSYPISPFLNHTGDDSSRALLIFGAGKPLGPHGLDWLKIHLANLTGLAKRLSNRERLEFVDGHMEDIVDSADHPLEGRRWWLTLEKPYQILALCMEIVAATRSEDPASYVSHVPIHQDGSFNGLQHYAALGRDVVAAQSVNLIPHYRPRDAYLDVVEQVEGMRARDEEEGSLLAASLKGCITRKVVKQTVMTTVYGVTKYGADLQVQRRLQEIEGLDVNLAIASSYISSKIFEALGNIFQSTANIQNWLKYNAVLLSSLRKVAVFWVTPLGLPIVQPYYKDQTNCKINSNKQKNAFPPNFIHSLDATHMLLTALHTKVEGIIFAAVHDCYWSHPSDVDSMNRICREQFVALHNEPILENLARQFKEAVDSNKPVPNNSRIALKKVSVPPKGDFDLTRVIDSEYFFS